MPMILSRGRISAFVGEGNIYDPEINQRHTLDSSDSCRSTVGGVYSGIETHRDHVKVKAFPLAWWCYRLVVDLARIWSAKSGNLGKWNHNWTDQTSCNYLFATYFDF